MASKKPSKPAAVEAPAPPINAERQARYDAMLREFFACVSAMRSLRRRFTTAKCDALERRITRLQKAIQRRLKE